MKPVIEVNLSLPARLRWHQALQGHLTQCRMVIQTIAGLVERPADVLVETALLLYRPLLDTYEEDLHAIADVLDVDVNDLRWIHLSYDLAQCAGAWGQYPLGCTAGIFPVKAGIAHVRTLDWPLPLRKHTAYIRYSYAGRPLFSTVGFPGFAGVLTGMRENAFSVALNYAPSDQLLPSRYISPMFALRQTLETCRTYEDAVATLTDIGLSSPAFFTVAGTKPGEGCIIERSPLEYIERPLRKGHPLVQANHFAETNNFAEENQHAADYLSHSRSRERAMRSKIKAGLPFAEILRGDPIVNDLTIQRIAMVPATGLLKAL